MVDCITVMQVLSHYQIHSHTITLLPTDQTYYYH